MTFRSYRRRRKLRNAIKLLALLIFFLIGVPVLLVRCIQAPHIADVPIINIWNVKTNTLMALTLEEYVVGVVAAEMPVSFSREALKAQAVAARTYAWQRIQNDVRSADHPEAHLTTDYQSGQAWISLADLRDGWGLVEFYLNKHKIEQAVAETRGVVATYQGQPILAVYHSTSGGRTENSEHYWADTVPYLRSVDDPYGIHSPYQYTTACFTQAEFLRLMEIQELGQVRIVERYPSGRVQIMEAGGKWFTGREVRQRLGLRSSWFSMAWAGQDLNFSVWGYGHGVGMPQYGADGMAKAGYDYQQILQYYYQGITLESAY